jgi:hypothetical protein
MIESPSQKRKYVSSKELAKATVGLPGLSVDVPITQPQVNWMRSRFRRATLKESVRVASGYVDFLVPEIDSGRATIYLSVVSFFGRQVDVEEIRIQSLSVNRSGFEDVSEGSSPEFHLSPRSINLVHCEVALRSAAVRTLVKAVKPHPVPISTPDAYTTLAGYFICLSGKHRARIGFSLEPVCTKLNFNHDFRVSSQGGA